MQQNTILQPSDMAKLHAQSGLEQRPWTAQEFAQLCAAENSLLIKQDYGFALGRVIHTEAELLLLIVSQAQRKQGLGKTYLQLFEEAARQRGAKILFFGSWRRKYRRARTISKMRLRRARLAQSLLPQNEWHPRRCFGSGENFGLAHFIIGFILVCRKIG